jgi:hypothetical protein
MVECWQRFSSVACNVGEGRVVRYQRAQLHMRDYILFLDLPLRDPSFHLITAQREPGSIIVLLSMDTMAYEYERRSKKAS